MIALDAALCSDGDRRSAARRLDLSCKAVVDRITAACVAMQTAALFLRTLQLEPSTAPQAADVMELANGLVAVFSAGGASLEACRQVLLSAPPGSLAAERAAPALESLPTIRWWRPMPCSSRSQAWPAAPHLTAVRLSLRRSPVGWPAWAARFSCAASRAEVSLI